MADRLGCGRDKAETAPPHDTGRTYGYSDDEDGWDLFECYGGRKFGTGTYGFIRESFRQDVQVRLGDARRDIGLNVKFWTFTDAGRFQPSKAHMEELYNMDELSRVAEQEVAELVQMPERVAGSLVSLGVVDSPALHVPLARGSAQFAGLRAKVLLCASWAFQPLTLTTHHPPPTTHHPHSPRIPDSHLQAFRFDLREPRPVGDQRHTSRALRQVPVPNRRLSA